MKQMTKEEIIANPVFAMKCLIELLKDNKDNRCYSLCLAMCDLISDDYSVFEIALIMESIGITFEDVRRLTPELSRGGYESGFWFTDILNPAPRIEYLKKKIIETKNLNKSKVSN